MDRTTFFAYARRAPFGGRLSQQQIDGINAIFRQWEDRGYQDRRHLANILAQVFHETGGRMLPVRETFATSDAGAIRALDKAWKAGKLGSVKLPYWRRDKDGKSWFGRGQIQLTHKRNYQKLGDRLGIDLVGNPSLALDPDNGAAIAIVGMIEGLFTDKKLSDFLAPGLNDLEGAREVVNGRDKAKLIAGYHKNFLDALDAAFTASKTGTPADVRAEDAKPDNIAPAQSKSLWAILTTVFAGGGLGVVKEVAQGGASVLTAVSNPWAFGSLVFTISALGLFAWLIGSGRITFNRSKAA
jgi:predicted chitinase